jgi:hypothetical protein
MSSQSLTYLISWLPETLVSEEVDYRLVFTASGEVSFGLHVYCWHRFRFHFVPNNLNIFTLHIFISNHIYTLVKVTYQYNSITGQLVTYDIPGKQV